MTVLEAGGVILRITSKMSGTASMKSFAGDSPFQSHLGDCISALSPRNRDARLGNAPLEEAALSDLEDGAVVRKVDGAQVALEHQQRLLTRERRIVENGLLEAICGGASASVS